jgi:hypothetical protein
MIDRGIFNLKTPHQLFEKLQRDFAHVKKFPEDSDAWFNFFVTADHLADWVTGNEDDAKKMQQSHALLRVVHRLSINAKHYEQKPPKPGKLRTSPVESTHEAQVYTWDPNERKPVEAGKAYMLELSPMDAREIGLQDQFVSARNLAYRVVDFWAKQLGPKTD